MRRPYESPRPRVRRLAGLVLAAVLAGTGLAIVLGPPAGAATARTDAADRALADAYAPLVVIRAHPEPCGDGEPYLPTSVDAVLGQPAVTLRGPDGQVVATAPTARDLYGRGEGYYLDLPGDPLQPGCDYEQWFREVAKDIPPTVYAHVVRQTDRPGYLALQYWFFWVFNDWNDKHEGDWEMIQLLFRADNVAQALAGQPESVAYAQHEGAQTSPWDGGTLRHQGRHPVVYPAQGSHASFMEPATWFGKSSSAGFGCDDTSAPGTQLEPSIVVLPNTVSGPSDPFAWLAFDGRWGQQEVSFNNGPTGPNTKQQWTQPVTWVEQKGRDSAISLSPLPGDSEDMFCSLTAAGSLLFVDFLANPWLVSLVLIALVVVVVLLVRSTRWRPVIGGSLDVPRRAGQVISSSFAVWRRQPRLVLPLGLVLLGSGVLAAVLQAVILSRTSAGDLVDLTGESSAWASLAALAVGAVITIPVGLAVIAGVALGLAARAGRAGPARGLAVVGSLLVLVLVPSLLLATVLLLPLGLWLVARWAAAVPAAAAEGLGVRGALRHSTVLTRGHRWRTLALTLTLLVLATVPGPLVGALLLLATGLSFGATNLIAGAIGAILLPVAIIGLMLQFYDLRQTAGVDP